MTMIQRMMNLHRMVLNDVTIKKMNEKGLLIENKIKPEQLQPNSVDLTLANTWKKPIPNDTYNGIAVINTKKEPKYEEGRFLTWQMIDGKYIPPSIIIHPKEFLLLASEQVLNIPNGILSFVQGRSSVARLGLQTEQAGLIDAGFKGTITFEVYNETDHDLIFYEGMRVAQVYFFKAMYAKQPYGSKGKGSKYQQQIKATGSKIHLDKEWNHNV